jgi:hypothetical protein
MRSFFSVRCFLGSAVWAAPLGGSRRPPRGPRRRPSSAPPASASTGCGSEPSARGSLRARVFMLAQLRQLLRRASRGAAARGARCAGDPVPTPRGAARRPPCDCSSRLFFSSNRCKYAYNITFSTLGASRNSHSAISGKALLMTHPAALPSLEMTPSPLRHGTDAVVTLSEESAFSGGLFSQYLLAVTYPCVRAPAFSPQMEIFRASPQRRRSCSLSTSEARNHRKYGLTTSSSRRSCRSDDWLSPRPCTARGDRRLLHPALWERQATTFFSLSHILSHLPLSLSLSLSLSLPSCLVGQLSLSAAASNDIPQLLPFPSPWQGKTAAASAAAGI